MTRRLGKSSSPRRSVQMKHSLPSRPNSAHRRTILFPRYTCQQKARSLASRSDPQRVLPVRASERATRMPVWSGRLSHERSTKQSALTEGRRLVRFRQVCGTGNPQRWSRLQLPRLSTVNSRHAEDIAGVDRPGHLFRQQDRAPMPAPQDVIAHRLRAAAVPAPDPCHLVSGEVGKDVLPFVGMRVRHIKGSEHGASRGLLGTVEIIPGRFARFSRLCMHNALRRCIFLPS